LLAGPYSGWEQRFELLGNPSSSPEAQTARIHLVGPDYFSTLEVPLLQGRTWTATEVARGASLVIVNRAFAGSYDPGGDIVGSALKIPLLQTDRADRLTASGAGNWMQVIGVVGDALNDGLSQPDRPAIFAPYSTLMGTGTQILVRTRISFADQSPFTTKHSSPCSL
jgi:hypothetical protein